jgi:hypothetical protein
VFIVAIIYKFGGIQKSSFEYGNLVITSVSSFQILLSASSKVINSPTATISPAHIQ